MPNYHTNNLVIAANDADMQKVLTRIAQNLAANGESTGFELTAIDGLRSVNDLYRVLRGMIENRYWACFCGAPIDRDVASADAGSWGVHAENEDYVSAVSSAFESLTGNVNGVTVNVSFAPSGRPMSDTATVSCESYGGNWALTLIYDTAWRVNSEDVDLFFMGLPPGDYGIAFLDADEYDNYESINVFCGIHHGRAELHAAEVRSDDTLDVQDLRQERRSLSQMTKALIVDLGELAEVVGVCGWSHLEWDDEEEYDYLGDNPLAKWGFDINWSCPSTGDLSRVNEAVIAVLSKFPWVVGSTGAAYEGRERNVEHLIPGQPISLVSDWTNPYFMHAAIETRTASGDRLGNLDDRGGGMELSDNARVALACILPHVRAYADKVEPLMIRDGRQSNSRLIVRLELTDKPLERLLDDVHQLLKKASNRRSVCSVVEGDE